MYLKSVFILWCSISYFLVNQVNCQFNVISDDDFSPSVTARCDRGVMYINVATNEPFYGVVHTKDYRKSPCIVNGNGSVNTTLKVSLLATEQDEIYCGVHKYRGERTVAVVVRAHKSLELSEDKFYFLSCANSGYKNIRGGTAKVTLKLIDFHGQKVTRVVHGEPYNLRVELDSADPVSTMRIKNCFAFASSDTTHVELIDSSGCPTSSGLISNFAYNHSNYAADTTIYKMFKFPEGGKMHLQCDAVICRGGCPTPVCDPDSVGYKSRNQPIDGYAQLSASTTVFVIEPNDELLSLTNLEDCTEWRFPWLITLCIILAILLLLMLLVNLFMCSTLTCRCVKTEVVEREPSIIEDYDPYKVDWAASIPGPGSHYGSRMSLNKIDRYNDSTLKRSPYHGYDNDNYISDHRIPYHNHYNTLQHSPSHRPQSQFSTHSLKSHKSGKSIKSHQSKLPRDKPIEIDYSNYHNYRIP